MKLIFTFFLALLWLVSSSQTNPRHVYVKPYVKKNGTYVPGHYRTAPNQTNRDNFSTSPNVNPYNGKRGYVRPDNSQTAYPSNIPDTEVRNYKIDKKITCQFTDCSNASRALKIGDKGYVDDWVTHSRFCNEHSPRCGNINCTEFASVGFSGYDKYCNNHSNTCKSAGCTNKSKLRAQGDVDFGFDWARYTNYCDTHTPKCQNPSCSKHAAVSFSGYSKFCSVHVNTCQFSSCSKLARKRTEGDFSYSAYEVSFLKYCDLHTPNCKFPNCNSKASARSNGFKSYCFAHKD